MWRAKRARKNCHMYQKNQACFCQYNHVNYRIWEHQFILLPILEGAYAPCAPPLNPPLVTWLKVRTLRCFKQLLSISWWSTSDWSHFWSRLFRSTSEKHGLICVSSFVRRMDKCLMEHLDETGTESVSLLVTYYVFYLYWRSKENVTKCRCNFFHNKTDKLKFSYINSILNVLRRNLFTKFGFSGRRQWHGNLHQSGRVSLQSKHVSKGWISSSF